MNNKEMFADISIHHGSTRVNLSKRTPFSYMFFAQSVQNEHIVGGCVSLSTVTPSKPIHEFW